MCVKQGNAMAKNESIGEEKRNWMWDTHTQTHTHTRLHTHTQAHTKKQTRTGTE